MSVLDHQTIVIEFDSHEFFLIALVNVRKQLYHDFRHHPEDLNVHNIHFLFLLEGRNILFVVSPYHLVQKAVRNME